MFAIPDLKNKSESEILQALHEYESNDPIENSRIGTEVWNMAVGLKKNSPFVAQLRLFGIDKMELGFERGISMISREMEIIPDFYNHFKLIQMMITTCDCFYACMDYEAAQLVLDRAYALFSKVKNSPDTAKYHLSGLNLKFHTCLLQWATTNNSTSFQLANVAINEAIEHIGEPEIKKLFKSCVKLADLSKELIDKDKWLQLFSAALDKSNCERRQYDAFRLDIGLLRGEVLIKLKNIQDAELLIGNLMQEYFCSAKLYYLSFQLLELKNGSKQEFLHLLQDFKDKAVKSDRNVVYSILHMLAQNGCAKDALIAFDALSNCDVTAREQILIHKLHIILSQNSQDDYIATTEILQEFGDFNNTSEISKQIMIMLWKRGDLAGSQSEYNDAIQWYELSSRHLLPNLVDSRNNAKLHRKIAYCQLKLGLPCLDTALKSVGLDPRPNHNSSFLLFQVYLGMDDIEQALKNLKEISYLEHAEYYLAAADYAYQLVASSTTSTSVKEVKPVVIILRNLIRIQYDSLPISAEELLQNIIKATKLLEIIKDQVECEWLFRTTYNSAIKVPKEVSLLYFEQAITIWLLTEQSHIEVITNCLNIAIDCRLQSAYVTRNEAIDDHLQKAKDLLKMLQEDRFTSTIATKFEIQILIMDGSYDQAFQLISDCNLELSVWKELAHLLIEKLKCPSRLVCKTLARLMEQIEDQMDEYSRWSRLTIRAHLESQKPDSCLEFANNMLILCKSNVSLDQVDILWVVVNLWNKGREIGGRNKFIETAVELCCFCDESNQTQHIKRAYQELLQPPFR